MRKEIAFKTRASGRLIRTDKIQTTASSSRINSFFLPRVENGFTIAETMKLREFEKLSSFTFISIMSNGCESEH